MPTTIYDTIIVGNSLNNFDGVCVGTPANLAITAGCFGPLGMSFTTPATTPVFLSRVGISMVGIDPTAGTLIVPTTNGTSLVQLLANDPTIAQNPNYDPTAVPPALNGPPGVGPGALLTDLGSVSDTALLATFQTYYFYSNYVLAPSTRYWIYIQDVSITAQAVAGAITGCGWGWISPPAWPPPTAIGAAAEYFWNYESLLDFPGGGYGAWANATQHTPYQMQIVVGP